MSNEGNDDGSYSNISCGLHSMTPKMIVGIVGTVECEKKTMYTIRCVMVTNDMEWVVRRRYSEFLEIKDDLLTFFSRISVNQCFGCRWFSQSLHGFEFPRKQLIASRDPDVIRQRRKRLDSFARLLAAHTFSAIPKCVNCSKGPFSRIRDFFLKSASIPDHLSFKSIRLSLAPEAFAPISDPNKSKIEYRRGNGILRVLQVEKPVCSKRNEYEIAMRDYERKKLLQKKMSSIASLLSHTGDEDWNDRVNDDTFLNESDDDEEELDMTGVAIEMEESAQRLEPLTRQPSGNLWQPWELVNPTGGTVKDT